MIAFLFLCFLAISFLVNGIFGFLDSEFSNILSTLLIIAGLGVIGTIFALMHEGEL